METGYSCPGRYGKGDPGNLPAEVCPQVSRKRFAVVGGCLSCRQLRLFPYSRYILRGTVGFVAALCYGLSSGGPKTYEQANHCCTPTRWGREGSACGHNTL